MNRDDLILEFLAEKLEEIKRLNYSNVYCATESDDETFEATVETNSAIDNLLKNELPNFLNDAPEEREHQYPYIPDGYYPAVMLACRNLKKGYSLELSCKMSESKFKNKFNWEQIQEYVIERYSSKK